MSENNGPIIFSTSEDKDAQFKMAGQFHADGNIEQALKWLEKAAENGHVQAKTNLGLMYFFGEGIDQDYALAFKWFKSAAGNDDLTARYYLSLCFLDGLGVEADEDYAMRVLWKCASDGMDWAQYTLAECYEQGRVVKQDLFEAVSWYARAAQGDVPEANERFRQLYYENEFTDANGDKRFFWFEEENLNGEN